jgi:hypothetical protein
VPARRPAVRAGVALIARGGGRTRLARGLGPRSAAVMCRPGEGFGPKFLVLAGSAVRGAAGVTVGAAKAALAEAGRRRGRGGRLVRRAGTAVDCVQRKAGAAHAPPAAGTHPHPHLYHLYLYLHLYLDLCLPAPAPAPLPVPVSVPACACAVCGAAGCRLVGVTR